METRKLLLVVGLSFGAALLLLALLLWREMGRRK
jgi:hypothetical protein